MFTGSIEILGILARVNYNLQFQYYRTDLLALVLNLVKLDLARSSMVHVLVTVTGVQQNSRKLIL